MTKAAASVFGDDNRIISACSRPEIPPLEAAQVHFVWVRAMAVEEGLRATEIAFGDRVPRDVHFSNVSAALQCEQSASRVLFAGFGARSQLRLLALSSL